MNQEIINDLDRLVTANTQPLYYGVYYKGVLISISKTRMYKTIASAKCAVTSFCLFYTTGSLLYIKGEQRAEAKLLSKELLKNGTLEIKLL